MNNKCKLTLVINAGSSSIKYKVFNIVNDGVIASGQCEKIGNKMGIFSLKFNKDGKQVKLEQNIPLPNHEVGISKILDELKKQNVISDFNAIKGIGHRVAMGGKLPNSCIIDLKTKNYLKSLFPLAPLHNPPEVKTVETFEKILPKVKNVGVYDTSFHTTLDEVNNYPLDRKVMEKYKIRKYGMHGTSYRYITTKMQNILHKKSINLVVCHLGNGASICEIKDNKSYNTTMGLTPLEGLMMGTRCGDVDPTVCTYLIREGYTVDQVDNLLNKESGFLGVTGITDCRDVELAANKGDKNAKLALDMFVSRVAKYVVSYVNDLAKKVDAIIFTAGIGENSSFIVNKVIEKLPILNLEIDHKLLNEKYEDFKKISTNSSSLPIYQIHTNEELVIHQDVKKILKLI